MEKRNLQVDLYTARKWYTSNNTALKELALQVFTEEELTFNFERLVDSIIMYPVLCASNHAKHMAALSKLQILADHFNSLRIKGNLKPGYFLAGIENCEYKIVKHDTVRYPGVVYFLEKTDLLKALSEFDSGELAALIS